MAVNDTNQPNGVFVEETNVWDQIAGLDPEKPEDLKLLITRLYQNINLISIALNLKDTGIYDNAQEFVTGMNYFPDPNLNSGTPSVANLRPVYRTTVIMGALQGIGVPTAANHNIDPNSSFILTQAYGAATDPIGLNYTPIPNNDIHVDITSTQVIITPTANYSAFTTCYFVVEYLKF